MEGKIGGRLVTVQTTRRPNDQTDDQFEDVVRIWIRTKFILCRFKGFGIRVRVRVRFELNRCTCPAHRSAV